MTLIGSYDTIVKTTDSLSSIPSEPVSNTLVFLGLSLQDS